MYLYTSLYTSIARPFFRCTECMLHTPHLRVTAYAGPNRAVALPAAALARDWDVVVTTYGVLQAEHSARQKELLAELEMTEEEVEAFSASSSEDFALAPAPSPY